MTQTVLLGDICVQITDGTHSTVKDNEKGDHYLLSAKNIKDRIIISSKERRIDKPTLDSLRKRTKTAKGDVLVTSVGTIGETAIIEDDLPNYEFQRSVLILKPNTDIVNPRYLYYYMRNLKKTFISMATGAVQKCLFIGQMKSVSIELPDLETQKKIADILGTIDEKIELNRRMNETLEQMGQALFRHYFIDNPEAEKWEEKPLDEIADFLNGLAMQKYPKAEGEAILPVIKIREVSSGITANTDIASAGIPEQYIVHSGDLLFSWSGTLLVKFWSEGEGALNQHLFKVTSQGYPEWLYYYWTTHHLDDFIQTAKSKATTMGHIQRKHLKQAMVLVPDAEMLEKIGDKIQPLIDVSKENAQQIQTLTTLRDTLLPRLISGKARV